MELFGVKFAALDTPIERRLQTAAVLYWTSYLLLYGVCECYFLDCRQASFVTLPLTKGQTGTSQFLYLLLFTPYFWITLLYFGWLWFDFLQPHRGGRRLECIRSCRIWKYFRNFFPIKIVKTSELDPKKNYVCGYHPHGIIGVGAFTSFGTEAAHFSKLFTNMTPYLLTLNIQFWFPLYRDMLMASGLCAVSRESIRWLLSCSGTGNMVVIVIGGAKEALDAHPGIVRLTLRRRKGFVREALQHGASLVPIFSFGENELFNQVPNPEGSLLRKFQDIFCSMAGFSPPIFHGRGIFQYNLGYIPYRKEVSVVVGKPIDVELNRNPTESQIDEYHQLYMDKLKELFDEHKKNYEFYKDLSLELV